MSDKTTRTGATTTSRYHWIITLQHYGLRGEVTANTVDGSADLPPGSSRSAAFKGVMSEGRVIGLRADAIVNVLFFSLELDDLPGQEQPT